MALGATVCKAFIDVSDIDRGYYESRSITIARHPSETPARMMVRLLAWLMFAGDKTEFGRGLSTEGDPAVYETNDAGDIARWIEVGCPDIKTLRKAAGKSEDVVVLAYDEARIEPWWQSRKGDMSKIDKLSVRWISDDDLEKLADMAGRNMKFAATVQDGVVWLADDSHNIEIEVKTLMRRGEPVF